MGTTVDESLHYMNSTCILAHTGLHFYQLSIEELNDEKVASNLALAETILNLEEN